MKTFGFTRASDFAFNVGLGMSVVVVVLAVDVSFDFDCDPHHLEAVILVVTSLAVTNVTNVCFSLAFCNYHCAGSVSMMIFWGACFLVELLPLLERFIARRRPLVDRLRLSPQVCP